MTCGNICEVKEFDGEGRAMGANVFSFDKGWEFYRTELSTVLEDVEAAEDCFQSVEIPHDWLIYDVKNLYRDGCGWYRKKFRMDRRKGKVILRFGGVYMDSTVYVNGGKVMDWKYGYSTFDADITEALRQGDNEIVVQVRYQAPNSRWYSGAGIYRSVMLKLCGKAWLPLDGTYVSIRPCDGKGQAFLKTKGSICTESVTADCPVPGVTDGTMPVTANCPVPGATDSIVPETVTGFVPEAQTGTTRMNRFLLEAQTETAGETEKCYLRYSLWKESEKVRELAVIPCGEPLCAEVEQPLLWDVEDPQCYELLVELCERSDGGQEIIRDWDRITIGFRTITFDPENGCYLNGRSLKIHGVCEHHDLGCLGAAFHAEAMERKLRILKAMGVNAIRTSHNMQDPEFMELADRMGFLVVDEAFDMWERPKTTYDYGCYFKEWQEKDVRSWVRRDRNHPCVMLWSIGNEIYDTHADEHGQEITRQLMGYVREHDPRENAPITIGSNYMAWENAQKCADIVRFAGYNYGEKYYEEQHRKYPDWIMYGSETASLVQSRGIYHFPLKQSVLAEEDEQCSALGNSTTSWGARSLEKCITGDRAGYIFGQFLWSGFDYIGEPTPYHTKNSYFGQIDTAGFPKDAYYVFQAGWTDYRKAPMVHLFPYWDFNPGQKIDVRACTNGAAVELFVNGISRGRQKIDHGKGEKLLGDWQVSYEPGTITAIAYDEDGTEIARESRSSFGDSHAIRLTADRQTLPTGSDKLCFLTIETVDSEGNPVENAADYVRVDISGPGRLLGMDNGDSTDYDEYKTNVRKLFSGKLLAVIGSIPEAMGSAGEVIGSTLNGGDIRVTVTGEGLKPAELILHTYSSPGSEEKLKSAENMSDICDSSCLGGMIKPTGAMSPIGHVFEQGDQDISDQEGCSESGISGESGAAEPVCRLMRSHPVRKVEIHALEGQRITKEKRELAVEAVVYPAAAEPELIWKAVNESGIDIGFAAVREMPETEKPVETCLQGEANTEEGLDGRSDMKGGIGRKAIVTACGDGEFYVRCMAREGDKTVLISQLEFSAEGLGCAFLNPYELISAGLYTDSLGEIGNGNEKGIATARDGVSGVVYSGIDFGEFGSDEITLPVFALSDEEYPIEIWLGKPFESGSRLLETVIYQKPSKWNVYQEETYKLPERIKGIATLGFVMRAKVHLKGFRFSRLEKAFERLWAADADSVYGDSFQKDGRTVRDIGNNVTFVYENMNFGEEGTGSVTVCGRTPLRRNSIHIHFTDQRGEQANRILEFAGEDGEEHEQTFFIEKFIGCGKLEIIFLPGSCFDLVSIWFGKSSAPDTF